LIGFGEALLREAGHRIETARRALRQRKYAYCLRQSQEAVELSLKGVLRLKGVEYPKFHDVSDVLLRSSGLFPVWFSNQIRFFAEVSRKLAETREASMYGFEELGQAPDQAVSRKSARIAFESAQKVFKACKTLFSRRR